MATNGPIHLNMWRTMRSGLKTTFELLGQTKNEAAVGVLLSALEASDLQVQSGGLESLLKRRGTAAPRELLSRWHELSERWKKVAAQKVARISGAIRDAILSGDEQLLKNGCDATVWLCEYDLVPTLVTATLDETNPHSELTAQTIVTLCETLCDDLSSSLDNKKQRHAQTARQHVVGALERSAAGFEQHKDKTLLEAYLMLVGCENAVLKRILQHPHDPAFASLIHLLASSPRPGIMRLLLNYLDHTDVPAAIYSILGRRSDLTFVRHFVQRFSEGIRPVEKNLLKRIESFAWLKEDLKVFSALGEQEQSGAIELAMCSGMSRRDVFQVIRESMASTHIATRRAAARRLGEFCGQDATALIANSIDDDDPEVQSHVARLLRGHRVSGAVSKLITLLDSPHSIVRDAARESLSDFSLGPFLNAFDELEDDARCERGALVTRVDPDAVEGLQKELQSNSRHRRLRAVHAVAAIRAAREVEDQLIALLNDGDHLIRTDAIVTLAACDSTKTRSALRDALLDENRGVREVAEEVLQILAEQTELTAAALANAARPLQLDMDMNQPATGGASA